MVTSSSSPLSVTEGGRDEVPKEEVDGRIRRLSHILQVSQMMTERETQHVLLVTANRTLPHINHNFQQDE